MKLSDFDINYLGVDSVMNVLDREYTLNITLALTISHNQKETSLYGVTVTTSYYFYQVYIEPSTTGKISRTFPVTFPAKISEQDTITEKFLVSAPEDEDIEPYFTGDMLYVFGIEEFFDKLVK